MSQVPADLLFERERVLETLQTVVAAARAGSGRTGLVSGPPGIGKTRILAALTSEAAAAGVLCLRATGHTLERDYGLGVVRQLFSQLPSGVMDAAMGSGGLGVDSPAEARPDALFATLQALFGALAGVAAERPLVLLVDDVQWVDEPSLRFLHYLARRVDSAGIALVLATRADPDNDSAVLPELYASAGLEVVLEPLTREAVADVLRHQLIDVADEFVDACMTWTLGNPLYLSELVATVIAEDLAPTESGARALAELAPGTIGRLVFVRIARAGDAAVSLAQAVAILGEAPSLAAAARLAGLDVGAAGTAAAALIRLDILDDSLGFRHPVVREAVYDDLPGPLRAARHLAAAEALHQLGSPVEAVAAQLVLAPAVEARWANDVLRRAARAAVVRGAPDAAARFLERALGSGRAQEPELEDVQRIALDVTRTHLLWIAGRSSAAMELADRTVRGRAGHDDAMAGDVDPPERAEPDAMLAMKLMLQCITPGSERPSPDQIDRFAAVAGRTQAERDCLLPVILYRTARGTPVSEIMPLVERVTSGATMDAANRRSPATWLFLLLHLGGVDQSLRFAERYLSAAEENDSVMWRAEALSVRAMACYRLGRPAEAEVDASAALAGADTTFAVTGPVSAATQMYARLELGDIAGAAAAADAFTFPSHREDTAFAAIAEAAIGRVRARAGAPEEGLELLRSAGERLDAVEWLITELSPWRIDAAQVLAGLGRREEALDLLGPAYDAARRFGAPSGLGRVLRVRALLEDPPSIDLLREAVAVYDGSSMRLKRAHALLELGATLRRSGFRRDARGPLAEAMDLATQAGAMPLLERATAEMAAAGGRPRTVATTGVEALTPSERRVAQLARAGLRNADIARELFVRPTTVEKHLAAAFRKLGIDSRSDLPPIP